MDDMLHYFFDWYTGQIWPNIIASGVLTLLVWVIGFRKLVKLHKKQKAELHNHISQEFAKLSDKNN
jgi:hypothetical protein